MWRKPLNHLRGSFLPCSFPPGDFAVFEGGDRRTAKSTGGLGGDHVEALNCATSTAWGLEICGVEWPALQTLLGNE